MLLVVIPAKAGIHFYSRISGFRIKCGMTNMGRLMPKKFKYIDTKLIHSGEPDPLIEGAVIMPIFQTAMFEQAGGMGLRYIRLNNTPNHIASHQKLASLENAEAALVTSSGMAAMMWALEAKLR